MLPLAADEDVDGSSRRVPCFRGCHAFADTVGSEIPGATTAKACLPPRLSCFRGGLAASSAPNRTCESMALNGCWVVDLLLGKS
jgi:hypothetical protein